MGRFSSMVRSALCLCVTLAALLAPSAPAGAQDFRSGLSAYNRGDYLAAVREWWPLAEHNDANAQAGLGFLFFKGLGVRQDDAQAAAWFGRAAEQGQPEAQLLLGSLYYYGSGVRRDYVLAYKWCDLAQANGVSEALECREAAARRMSTPQIDQSSRLVTEWFARHTPPPGR